MTIPVPGNTDFTDGNGNMSKSMVLYFNKVSTRLDALAAVLPPSYPAPTDLGSAITKINELNTILTALLAAAKK
ncbi:hypothetical protein KGP36_07185 [Patescibacteria group bacterium]|nr:hypothetical protein [Patescibacteria group bacterium]